MSTPWRCRGCGKLLAMVNEQAIEVRTGKDREHRLVYMARLPATAICGCGARNEQPAQRVEKENVVRR